MQSVPARDGSAGPNPPRSGAPTCIALLGNPNTGKSTIFNRLTGLRQKTSNFPGTTIDAHIGMTTLAGPAGEAIAAHLLDLPGVYSLDVDDAESRVCRSALTSNAIPGATPPPGAVCIALDASALRQGLRFVGEVSRSRLPAVVALTMLDVARRRGIEVDIAALESKLGCPVRPVNARTGDGFSDLRLALANPVIPRTTPPADEAGFRAWIDDLHEASAPMVPDSGPDRLSARFDWAFTHPLLGTAVFAAIMVGLFWLLFRIAVYPMNWIQTGFALAGEGMAHILPPGFVRDLMVNGVVAGLAGAIVFLPQICLLFFLLSILEDTGYLARAAFVADRLLRRVGLPGSAFIPLLSSHACAIPGILAARAIPDRRERLATILVAPFMTCSARLPVYALLVSLLFSHSPSLAAIAFAGCYALGAVAGVLSAMVARGSILKGSGTPMTLELPSYKTPSLRTALLTAYDKGSVFLRKAGVFIFAFAVMLWWLSSFPRSAPPAGSVQLREQAAALMEMESHGSEIHTTTEPSSEAASLREQADREEARSVLANSFAGRLGRLLEPIFAPLGFDWRVNIGVVTSFAAREIFVSTTAIVFAGDQAAPENHGVIDAARAAVRDDGVTPVFTRAASWSLLVFYVLAMQCFSTLVVTARETGSAKWAVLQFTWMTGLAYIAAFATRHLIFWIDAAHGAGGVAS